MLAVLHDKAVKDLLGINCCFWNCMCICYVALLYSWLSCTLSLW